MSILVQNVSMQQLKHEFESFLKRFYRKLLVLQPQIYVSFKHHQRCCTHTDDLERVYLQMGMSLIMHPPHISLTIY